MAEKLIDGMSGPWEPQKYRDTYREDLMKRINEKVRNKETHTLTEPEKEAKPKKSADVIADSTKSREEYGKSVQYSVTCLTQWLERYGTDDTVLVFLGDHQPIARVSGDGASRDVPVTIVAKDPKVLDAIDDWHWTDGLRPAHDAPVWKMSSFRDRFLTAYGSTPHPSKG